MNTDDLQKILHDIDEQLAATPARGLSGTWLSDEFGRCYQRYESLTNQMELIADKLSAAICTRMANSPGADPFRICSLACGDGVMDELVLTRVLQTQPAGRIEFLGIEINEALCRAEAECLAKLPIKAQVLCLDLDRLKPSDAPNMDFVYMVHGHYYTPDFVGQLEAILTLREPGTVLQIVSAENSVYNQLYLRFWRHELGRSWWLAEHLLASLRTHGLEPDVQRIVATLDITRCFDEGMASAFSRDFLDFLCHAPLSAYSPSLQRLCVSWLQAAADQRDGRYVLDHPCLFLTIPPR